MRYKRGIIVDVHVSYIMDPLVFGHFVGYDFTDDLAREGLISRRQYHEWGHPSGNTAPWERRR